MTTATHKDQNIHLSTSRLHPKRILFATDFSSQASIAFKWAARLSRHFGSRLYMAHVLAPVYYAASSGVLAPILQEEEMKLAHEKLTRYFSRMTELDPVNYEEIITCGSAKDLIQQIVKERDIEFVVMGSHGRGGVSKLALGSVAESALRHLHCPVLICGPHCRRTYQSPKSIVLATDLSVNSLRAAQYAASLAEEFHAQLAVVHVFPANETSAAQKRHVEKEMAEMIPSDLRNTAQYSIRSGEPAPELLRVAKFVNASLIVMGVNEKETMADHAPWSTISKVIREAHCPVLAVQPHIA